MTDVPYAAADGIAADPDTMAMPDAPWPMDDPADADPGAPDRLAIALGIAGLLPQAAALAAPMLGMGWVDPGRLALVYGALILSFLGGAWWGIALTRAEGRRRAILLLLGIGASLLGFCVQGLAGPGTMRPVLIVLGAAILASCGVDAALVRDGMMARWWGVLRLTLSVGLGTLTILAGALAR